MDNKDDENPLPPFPDEDIQATKFEEDMPVAAEEESGEESAPAKENPFANFDKNPEDVGEEESASRPSADQMTEEDFMRPPTVNYVRSKENMIKFGDDIGLTNKDPMLKNVNIGVGWNARSIEGEPIDLDLSAFLLDNKDMTRMDEDFVFYNSRESLQKEVRHLGDSRTGAGDGDDENVEVALQPLHFDVKKINFVISIYDGEYREHTFNMVKNLYFRITNADSEEELCRLDIPAEMLNDMKGTAILVGSLFRDGPKWRFHALGEEIEKGGLGEIARRYGLLIP